MSEELINWLRAQLDEDERKALAATSGPWWDSPVMAAPGHHTIRGGPADWRGFDGSLGGDTRPIARIAPAPDYEGSFVTDHDADAEHIARHDPSRVLREVEAKRKILDGHSPHKRGACPVCWRVTPKSSRREDYPCPTLRLLAAPYSDRPGYQEAWRP